MPIKQGTPMANLFDNLIDRAANLVTRGDYRRMHEALPGVEAQLAIEDAGWSRWNSPTGRDANDLPEEARAELVRRSRRYFIYDPLCRQAIRLFVSYCIGRGLSIQATEDVPERPAAGQEESEQGIAPDAPDAATQSLQADANEFWEHPDNAVVFSVLGQHRSAEKINIDGELYFACFPGADASDVTRVRTFMDCLEVTKVITNPQDYSENWYYLREWNDIVEGRQALLYPDIALYGKKLPTITEKMARAYQIPDSVDVATCNEGKDNVYVLHRPLNTVGVRGYPLLTPAMDWAKVQRKFLEDQGDDLGGARTLRVEPQGQRPCRRAREHAAGGESGERHRPVHAGTDLSRPVLSRGCHALNERWVTVGAGERAIGRAERLYRVAQLHAPVLPRRGHPRALFR
jgi:hypothetical protein